MIRELRQEDIYDCITIVDAVWRFKEIFQPIELAELFLDIYTMGSLAGSNYGIVAEENGRVIGFLFGKSSTGKLYQTKYSGIRGQIRLLIDLFRITNVTLKRKLGYIGKINTHEINRRKAEPKREYEVNLFAVFPDLQGKGVGKDLMNSYINRCKKDGVNRITLDTDEECNYKFYEHFGYKKIAEFYSPIQEMYSQKSGTSYVYELKIV